MMEAWKQQIEDLLRLIPGYNPWDQADGVGAWLDHRAAHDAINWFPENLCHMEGSDCGQPFVLSPWEAAVVGNLFGWKRKDEKGRVVRRYRKGLLYIARGNGKTPLTAGIGLFAFFTDDEYGAQCYLAAGAKEQAGALFRNALGMVKLNPELSERIKAYEGDQHRCIVLKDDQFTFLKTIPADAATQHGGIPHFIALDELHAQTNRNLLDVFETSMAKQTRAQPVLMMLTTADFDQPSTCNEVHAHACKVRDNGGDRAKPGYDPTFLPVIYELAEGDDWRDEANWIKANPNLGVSVSLQGLREAFVKAQENPLFENTFRRLHLNQKTSKASRLIPLNQWDDCGEASLKIEDYEGRVCYGGLDVSSREDLTSFYLVFPEPDESVAVFGWSWCPAAKVALRARKKAVPYDRWVKDGWLTQTPGDSIHYGMVEEKIVECDKRFQIRMIYADPCMVRASATRLMEEHGFQNRFVEFTQSMRDLSGPTKDLIFRIKQKQFRHDGNPVTRWAAGNVSGYFKGRIPEGENLADALDQVPVMPSKQASADKIDPIASIINALAALTANPSTGAAGCVYDRRGVLTL